MPLIQASCSAFHRPWRRPCAPSWYRMLLFSICRLTMAPMEQARHNDDPISAAQTADCANTTVRTCDTKITNTEPGNQGPSRDLSSCGLLSLMLALRLWWKASPLFPGVCIAGPRTWALGACLRTVRRLATSRCFILQAARKIMRKPAICSTVAAAKQSDCQMEPAGAAAKFVMKPVCRQPLKPEPKLASLSFVL